jgi:hypothetical protein
MVYRRANLLMRTGQQPRQGVFISYAPRGR